MKLNFNLFLLFSLTPKKVLRIYLLISIFKFTVKKVLPLFFALTMSVGPVFAWGWGGEGDCPFSKDKSNEEIKTEQVEESDE